MSSVLVITCVYIWLISYKKKWVQTFSYLFAFNLPLCFGSSNASSVSGILHLLVLLVEINLKIPSASGALLTLQIATIASTICCSTISIPINWHFDILNFWHSDILIRNAKVNLRYCKKRIKELLFWKNKSIILIKADYCLETFPQKSFLQSLVPQ